MMRSPSPLPDDVREKSGERINDIAIDLLGLAAVARKSHWNVRGELFGQLHDLFGKLYSECASQADTLAEHSAMLGLSVRGDHLEIAQGAIAEPLGEEKDGKALASFLFDQIKATLSELASAQKEVQSLGNEEGFQLLLDVSIALSKLGWMLGTYLEEEQEESEKPAKKGSPKRAAENE